MGTNFVNPLARTTMPRLHEGSGLRSQRDADAVPRVWQKTLTVAQQLGRLCQEVEQLQRELNRLRKRSSGSRTASAAATGMVFRGWWTNVATYNSQNVVFRTADGGSAGTYIAIADSIPPGTTPETGAPYWAALPYPPPGVWG